MTDVEEMLKVLAGQRASAEIVDTSMFFKGTEKQKAKWLDGAKKEMSAMHGKQVWNEIKEAEIREKLGLRPGEPTPKILPMRLVLAKKPDLEAEADSQNGATIGAEVAEAAFKARVRLVACGNFQADSEVNASEIECENLNPEALRLVYGRLAAEKHWEGLTLDISAAFLNSLLPENESILLRPPSVLVKLGLVPPDVIFHANKSIYGLRRGSYDWQSERTDKLHKAEAKAAKEHKHGD